ncbi:hypothetical protein D3C84_73580 [compost metagenome]
MPLAVPGASLSNRDRAMTDLHAEAPTVPIENLAPLTIFRMAKDVTGYDGGIDIDVVASSAFGVLATVPTFEHLQAGDEVRVYLDGESLPLNAEFKLGSGDLSRPLSLYLATSRFVPGPRRLYYELVRNQAVYARSAFLSVLVKLDRPGGEDIDPEPGHQGLVPAEVAANPVTAEHLRDGVKVRIFHYENKAVGDVIRLSWGGLMLTHTVKLEELNVPLELQVTGPQILEAGDSPNLLLTWEVHDQVFNTSQAWAPHVSVAVDTGHARLPAVVLPQVGDDGYIDLAQLGSTPLDIIVQANAPAFAVGDRVHLRFTGYIDSGLPTETLLQASVSGPLPQALTFTIANDKAWALANGLAAIDYRVVDAAGEQRSQRLTVGFKGQSVPLQAPSVHNVTDELPYDAVRASVLIPNYLGRTAGHEIVLVWLGTMADGKPTVYETSRIVTASQAGGTAPIAINVTAEHIRVLQSGVVTIYYRVRMTNLFSAGWRQSEPRALRISAADWLPAPVVETPGGELDPHFYPLGVQVSVNYPGMRQGDKVTLHCKGVDDAASWNQEEPVSQVGRPLMFSVPPHVVQLNLGTSISLDYEVIPASGGHPLPSHSLALAIRSETPVLSAPVLVGALNGRYDPMLAFEVAQVRISYPGMRASDRIQLSWQGTPGAGSPVLAERLGSDTGSVMVNVPASAVGANILHAVVFTYQVVRNELPPLQSDEVEIQVLAPAMAALPRPYIDQAWDNELDLDSFDGNALITVRRWPFIAPGQYAWLECRSGGEMLALLEAHPLEPGDAGFGLAVELPRSFLTGLADDSELTLHLRVGFNGSTDAGQAVDFPPNSYRVRQGQLHIVVSDNGLCGSALPSDWPLDPLTCALTLVGRPGATGQVTVNGSARFADDSQAMAVQLDAQGEQVVWLSDPFAETVLVSGHLDGTPARHVPVRFSDVFPFDQQGEDGQAVRARAASGALANGRSPNRVCFDAQGLPEATYVQVQLSGSAQVLGHSGQIVTLPLDAVTGDCIFDVVDTVAEAVTLTFHLPQVGSWAWFTKTLYFNNLPSLYSRAPAADPRPWFMRVNQTRSLENTHLRIPHMKVFLDHPDGINGGISARALNSDSKGLQTLVEPYLNMAAGDQIHIYCGDEQTPVTPLPYVVKPEEVNELLFIYVPQGRIPNGIHDIWFVVTPVGDNPGASARLKVKIKRTLPGGPNPNPGSPHHTGLMFPILPPGLIDWDVAQDGVTVHVYPWRYMEVGDTIILSWGGVKVTHQVREGEVGRPIALLVGFETIEEAGDGEELLVLYLLEDEVGNESDGTSLPSYAFVEISTFLLPRPVVEPLDAEGFIELGDLGPADPTLSVTVDFPDFIAGDEVVFHWRGFTDDAVALPVHTSPPLRVPQIPPPRLLQYDLPNALVQAIAGGLAYVSYKVTRTGFPTPLPSRTTAIGVRGVATQLGKPDVDGRDEDFLPDNLPRAVVRIPPWLGMFAGQVVRVVWQGTRGDGRPYAYMEERPLSGSQVGNEVVFVLDGEHVAALAGGNLELFYQVNNPTGEPWVSERREVWVGEPAPDLVRPDVLEAENDALDPEGIVVATTLVPVYTGMAAGQTVHLEWLSPIPAGNFFDFIPVTSARDLYFSVPEADITPSNGHEVRIRYIAREPGERSRYSDYLNLFIGEALTNPPQPKIEEAKGDVLDLLSFPGDAWVTVVPWRSISEQHHYWLRIHGEDEAGNERVVTLAEHKPVEPGEVDLGVRARLQRADLQRFAHESRIEVRMAVARNADIEEADAIVFPLRRYTIRQVQVSLTTPEIVEARGAVLELASFQGDATLKVEPWLGIEQGQRIWVDLKGTRNDSSLWRLPLVVAEPVSLQETTEGIIRSIPRAALETLADGTELSIHMAVNIRGEEDRDEAIEAPVMGYEMYVTAPVTLVVSTGGVASNRLSEYWQLPRESSGVTVFGNAGETITLNLPNSASFDDGSQHRKVVLDVFGEAQARVRSSNGYTTVTASRGNREVMAGLTFDTVFAIDAQNGKYQIRTNAASGAKANGRSTNRCFIEGNFYTTRPGMRFSVSGSARIVGYTGQTVHVILPITGGLTGWHFDVTNTRSETITVTFFDYGGLRFSRTMTFT